jgi:hypothetical protein
MQYAVCSECIFAYVWGWGREERNSGEAYLGRFSGHRPYRQFSPDKPMHCYLSPIKMEDIHYLESCDFTYLYIYIVYRNENSGRCFIL